MDNETALELEFADRCYQCDVVLLYDSEIESGLCTDCEEDEKFTLDELIEG